MAKKQFKTSSSPVKPSVAPSTFAKPVPEVPRIPFWKDKIIPALILFVVAFVLYAPSIPYDYVLDDQIVIVDNTFTKEGVSGIGKIFKYDTFQGYFGEKKQLVEGGRYRPLSLVTFAIEYSLMNGLNKELSHFINVLLYALTGLLLYRVMSQLLPPATASPWYWTVPFWTAMLFVMHPIHSEVVANIKGRDEIMTFLGALGAMYYTMRYLESNQSRYLFASSIAFFLGILSKENTITFLAIIPFSVYFFTNYSFGRNLRALFPLIITSIVYLIIRYKVLGYFSVKGEITDIMNNPFYGMTGGEKLATIFYTLLLYIKLLVFPHPLTHDYYPYHIPKLNWADMRALAALLLYAAMLFFAWRGYRQKSVLSYCILFFIASISIVSNLVFPVGSFMNERFAYISSLAVCLLLAHTALIYLPRWVGQWQVATGVVFALFSLGFCAKTYIRVPVWQNALTLNEAAIITSPESTRANCFIASAMFENIFKKDTTLSPERKRILLDSIDRYLDRSLEIYPQYNAALTLKSGTIGEYHKINNDDKALIEGFKKLISTSNANLPFIVTYMRYMNGATNNEPERRPQFVEFYKYAAHRYKDELYSNAKALEYVNLGLQIAPNDTELLQLRAGL